MPQKKKCRQIRSNPKTRNPHPSHTRCRSTRHRDPSSATSLKTASTTGCPTQPGKCQKTLALRQLSRRPSPQLRLPHVDLTRPPRATGRGVVVGPLTPPPTTASPSEPTLQRELVTFPLPGTKPQDDDVASQGSMTTWIGDRDGEALPKQEGRSFNFDWADENADEPPIAWEKVQAYTDFHDNKEAHQYWQWDMKEMKWRHVDPETGEVVYCSSELD